MANQEHGVKETLEIIKGAFTLAKKIVRVTKDGFQVIPDTISIVIDQEVQQDLAAAANDARKALMEMRDLELDEVGEVFSFSLNQVKELLEVIKEEADLQELQQTQEEEFKAAGMQMQKPESLKEEEEKPKKKSGKKKAGK